VAVCIQAPSEVLFIVLVSNACAAVRYNYTVANDDGCADLERRTALLEVPLRSISAAWKLSPEEAIELEQARRMYKFLLRCLHGIPETVLVAADMFHFGASVPAQISITFSAIVLLYNMMCCPSGCWRHVQVVSTRNVQVFPAS